MQPPGGYYYDQLTYPLSGQRTVAELVRYPWPDPTDPGYTRGLRERLDWIRTHTDAAAVLTLPAPVVHISQYLRGFEDWFVDFASDPIFLEALFDAVLEVTMEVARRELEAVGRNVNVVFFADDLGDQRRLPGPSRAVSPVHQAAASQIRGADPCHVGRQGDLPFVRLGGGCDRRSDGDRHRRPQPGANNGGRHGPRRAEAQVPRPDGLLGPTDTQHVLPHGSVDDVCRMVRQRIDVLGEGGGFVLASCHNIQPDVPVENVLAMFRCGRQYVSRWTPQRDPPSAVS